MNNVYQFSLDTKRALEKYSDYNGDKYINTDKFDANIKFDDIWNECHTELITKYSLPSFHLYEDGFQQGDATDEEVTELVTNINSIGGADTVDESGIYGFLDRKFLEIISPKVDQLIKEYNEFCEKALAED